MTSRSRTEGTPSTAVPPSPAGGVPLITFSARQISLLEALKIVTKKASERIVRFAYEYARNNGRKKITVVHKRSIMQLSDGLFVESAEAVAEHYPFIETEYLQLDNLVMELALDPHQFEHTVGQGGGIGLPVGVDRPEIGRRRLVERTM